MHRRDESSSGPTGETLDRRAMIKRALAAGSIGYVAPMILGSATPASAQAVSTTCLLVEECASPCGPDSLCDCVTIVGGGTTCVAPICTDIACQTNADCGTDSVCFTTGCCGEGSFCVPLCGTVSVDTSRVSPDSRWQH